MVAQNLPSFVDELMRSMHVRCSIAYLLLDSTYFYRFQIKRSI